MFGILFVLILFSAFSSGTETAMMAVNRYRLRHRARTGQRSAILVESLLRRPDRVLGLILFVNTLVNIAAASVATIIAIRLMGEIGLAIAPVATTVVILIFGELAPKTVAALHADRIAYPASYALYFLGRLLNPFVWVINQVTNGLLSIAGVRMDERSDEPITREELRTVVLESGGMIPRRHQRMLLSIIDLESVTVDDIMVPRNEIVGVDLNKSPDEILDVIAHSQHTRLPVYRENIDDIAGVVHVRRVARILRDKKEFSIADLEQLVHEPYFVPLGTPLHTQLLNFQRRRNRIGFVVDEYGVIQGLVTLEDILEEIVGEFTTDVQTLAQEIHPQADGTYLIDGTATLREINRQLHWNLPTEGPKTLNGLVLEHLETMPEPGTSLRVGPYTIEVTQTSGNAVRTVRINRQPFPVRGTDT